MKFEIVKLNAEKLHEYSFLLSKVFGESPRFSVESLEWLYLKNPEGSAVGFNAYDDTFLAAHYVCIPATLVMNGVQQKTLLSLNTATHPNYQGRGLFTKLATLTYQRAYELGFESIYGVANKNSTPGFINKLGFHLLSPLNAYLGFGPLNLTFYNFVNVQMYRKWTQSSVLWRSECPFNFANFSMLNRGIGITSSTNFELIKAYAELPQMDFQSNHTKSNPLGLRLFLGNIPSQLGRATLYFKIPNFLKPSPLNLIYKPLNANNLNIDFNKIYFSYLDFDAY